MQIDSDIHLTYCTNIHPGETWEETFDNLRRYVLPLKSRITTGEPFGVGLRLSDRASRELLSDGRLSRFKDWLAENSLYVFTLNGFPYGGFHRMTVKDQVYVPDWREPERVAYTKRLADALSRLLPEGLDGSISTSPLSYKPWLTNVDHESVFEQCARHLAEVALHLHDLRERGGPPIHVDLEPEPDCLIENTHETVEFFTHHLRRAGRSRLVEAGLSGAEAVDALIRHVGVCYDTCHFAVEFEQPASALDSLAEAEILVGKLQVSAALRLPLPTDSEQRQLAALELKPFAESTYLHQVVSRGAGGELRRYRDLPQALEAFSGDEGNEWRIHYHVPIFLETYGRLLSTQPDITDAVEIALRRGLTRHLEIETYTWDVLPPEMKADVVTSIAREYEWLLERITPRVDA